MSPQALQELDLVNQHINKGELARVDCQFPIRLFCFPTLGTPTGLISQLLPQSRMIEWLFLSYEPQGTITTYIKLYASLLLKDYFYRWLKENRERRHHLARK